MAANALLPRAGNVWAGGYSGLVQGSSFAGAQTRRHKAEIVAEMLNFLSLFEPAEIMAHGAIRRATLPAIQRGQA